MEHFLFCELYNQAANREISEIIHNLDSHRIEATLVDIILPKLKNIVCNCEKHKVNNCIPCKARSPTRNLTYNWFCKHPLQTNDLSFRNLVNQKQLIGQYIIPPILQDGLEQLGFIINCTSSSFCNQFGNSEE